MKACRRPILFLAALLVLWVPAHAGTISFTGDLATDATFLPPFSPPYVDGDYAQDAAVVQLFHVTTSSSMQAITFSYGGGVNGAGSTITASGFEPYLSLFDAAGNFLASTFFATTCPAGANTNSSTGFCFDVLLDGGVLAMGDYQIAISAFENMSSAENLGSGTLADGFTGLGNLAPGEDLHYAFDVILTDTSSVPEPSTLFSMMVALLAVAVVHFFNRKERSNESLTE
jgi:PEP-CTERM motif